MENGITTFKVKGTAKIQNVCECPDDMFRTSEHFVNKPGMIMQQHEPDCNAEKLVHCVHCQGDSKGLCNQNMTVSVVSSELLVGLQSNLV